MHGSTSMVHEGCCGEETRVFMPEAVRISGKQHSNQAAMQGCSIAAWNAVWHGTLACAHVGYST